MRAILLLAASASTTACFKADVANCAATCASSDDCPAGLVCTGAGRCAETASTVCTGGPDAAPDAAGPTLTVTVRNDRGVPAIGARVLATDSSGATVTDTTTANDGTATVAAPGPVAVTVIRTNSLGAYLSTIVGAEAGDELVFGADRNEDPTATANVTWPTDDNADRYGGWSSCQTYGFDVDATGGGGSPQEEAMSVDPTCEEGRDVLVTWKHINTSMPNHYLIGLDQPAGDVELSGTWEPYTLQRTNLQQLAPNVLETGGYLVGSSVVFRDGEPARGPGQLVGAVGGGGGASADLSLPATGAGREMFVTAWYDDGMTLRLQQIVDRIPPLGEYNLSVAPAMLPWVMADPMINATARTARWPELDAGPDDGPGDMVALEVEYQRGSTVYRWRIIAPVSAITDTTTIGERQIALPDLPGTEPFELQPGDVINATWIRRYAFTIGVGYPRARLRADAAIARTANPTEVRDRFFADPAITRVVASRFRY